MLKEKELNLDDEFSRIQLNLEMTSIDKKIKKILITSTVRDEGKSFICQMLAKKYRESNKKVALLDLNMRNPKKYNYYKTIDREVAVGFKVEEEPYFDLYTYAKKYVYPSKILESKELFNLINDLEEKYDIVIIDTPPVLEYLDAVIALKFASDVVFVVRSNLADREDVKEAISILERAKANILGLVLTNNLG